VLNHASLVAEPYFAIFDLIVGEAIDDDGDDDNDYEDDDSDDDDDDED